MSSKKGEKTTDAIKILRKMFVDDDPETQQMLEEIEAENDIARTIYAMRKEAGLSQAELAKMIGTQASAICRLEDADYEGHSLSMLKKIAKALNQKVQITFVPLEGAEAA
jgi:ribosome-binding protein aMBF1 (putative translation factor)